MEYVSVYMGYEYWIMHKKLIKTGDNSYNVRYSQNTLMPFYLS